MPARIPNIIRPMLDEYMQMFERQLPGLMGGFYLHGSLPLSAFDNNFSDIDFVAIITRRATDADLKHLAAIHETIKRQYPDWPLSGSYLQTGDFGKTEAQIEPYPYYHKDTLQARGHHDINPITWWMLKNKGITLLGPDVRELPFTVDWGEIVTYMRDNLNSYWRGFTRNPGRMGWLLFDYGIQWAILGVLRQFYAFRERDIISKTGAGEYALKHLPRRWHKIVQEALNIRNYTKGSLYRWRITRAWDAWQFLRYIISVCNNIS